MWKLALDRSNAADLPAPLGSDSVISDIVNNARQARDIAAMKTKKANDLANGQAKSIFFTLFMLWMSGSGINIFSIMITVGTLFTPLKGFLNLNTSFKHLEGEGVDLLFPKVKYLFFNLVVLGATTYKLQSMGLLPFAAGDWIGLIPYKHVFEFSTGTLH